MKTSDTTYSVNNKKQLQDIAIRGGATYEED